MFALIVSLFSWVTIAHSWSIEFGFTIAPPERDESIANATISNMSLYNVTLYWEEYRFQCTIAPTEYNAYYFCNTSSIEYVDECDASTSTNPVQYGLQIDNKNTTQIDVDSIIISQSETRTTYTFTSFCVDTSTTNYAPSDTVSNHCSNSAAALDIISIQNNHNYLFTFNANTSGVPELNMILTDSPAECTLEWGDYTYDDTYDDQYDYGDDQFNTDYSDYDTNWDSSIDEFGYDDSDSDAFDAPDDYDTNWYENLGMNNTNIIDTDTDTDWLDSDTDLDWNVLDIDSQLMATGHIIIENVENYYDVFPDGQVISIYIGNLDLSCGGIITNVAITDNNYWKNKWINYTVSQAYQTEFVYFVATSDMILHPLSLPIGIKIIKTTMDGITETLISESVISSFDAGMQFDFGSNFCMGIKDKTEVQNEDEYINDVEGSVENDEKHTDTVLMIICILLLVLGIIGIYWGYKRHKQRFRQQLLFMEQQDTQQNVGIGLIEI